MTRGLPSRPVSAQISCSRATFGTMSSSRGVVIHPSACRAIQLNVLSVPAAPISAGTLPRTGFGHAQLSPNRTNSPSYSACSSAHRERIDSRYSRNIVRRFAGGTP
jgi:hypothetical protein